MMVNGRPNTLTIVLDPDKNMIIICDNNRVNPRSDELRFVQTKLLGPEDARQLVTPSPLNHSYHQVQLLCLGVY